MSSRRIGADAARDKAGLARPDPIGIITASDAQTSFKVDTIGTYARKWWPDAINAMRHTLPDPKLDCQCRKCKVGTGWDLHHPTERTFKLLAGWQHQDLAFGIRRVDVARDELADDNDALGEHMLDMRDRVRLRWAPRTAKPIYFGALNFYLVDYCSVGEQRRNCLVYRKGMRVRTELRFLNSGVVRANGLDRLDRLPEVDLEALFDKHLRWVIPY